MKLFTYNRILVVGDIILDKYIHGIATRLSPEAPVPVVKHTRIEYRPGGAANVVANIKALGGNPVLIGVVGNDDSCHELKTAGVYTWNSVTDSTRPTTVKTRVIANGQQVLRIDNEETKPLPDSLAELLRGQVTAYAPTAAAIIISDYLKGVVDRTLLATIKEVADCWGIPVFLDPKIAHAKDYFSYPVTVMTPNLQEAAGMYPLHTVTSDIEDIGQTLLLHANSRHVLVTRGEQGMSLFTQCGPTTHIPSAAKAVFDVSGAGDTVIATLALAYASGYTMLEAAELANKAAGIVVGKPGTATVSFEELEKESNET